MKRLAFTFFIIALIIYFLTSAGATPFDYFTRLSDSFLAGKYYLTENPSWLSELIPAGVDKFFVVYPPMPALLAIPFRFFFDGNFQQQYLAHILGAGIVALTMLSSWTIKKDKILAVWSGLLVGIGSIIWYMSASGSVWYLGQISAAFFLTAAIFESLLKKRPLLIGIFLGAAFLSRLHTILALPLFLYLLYDKDWFKKYFYLGLGILPFIAFDFYYNFIRFGTIFDQAYFLLPKILNETDKPWFTKGVFNLAYIPDNIKAMFWTFPRILNTFPYIQPSWAGLAIWITTPAFIYSVRAPLKEKVVKISWLSILLIFMVVASHGGTGWAQFGYRFAVDFYPILILLTIKGASKGKLEWHHWLLLVIGVVVNLWGVLWINKFGWVSF
jgi:hypothetical protein